MAKAKSGKTLSENALVFIVKTKDYSSSIVDGGLDVKS
jgi:hypothetical protein